jgi:hypothetical protein
VKVVKEGNGFQRGREVTSTAAMVTQHPPVLQASDGVLDPGAASSMATPGPVAADPVALEHRRDELRDAAIAAVGENAGVLAAQGFDRRATVVDGVVTIARTATTDGDDAQVAPAGEDLRVARVA